MEDSEEQRTLPVALLYLMLMARSAGTRLELLMALAGAQDLVQGSVQDSVQPIFLVNLVVVPSVAGQLLGSREERCCLLPSLRLESSS